MFYEKQKLLLTEQYPYGQRNYERTTTRKDKHSPLL